MAKRLDTIVTRKSLTKRGLRYYFIRKAPNGETLERSQMYRSRQGRNAAVRRILASERAKVERE